MHCEDGEIDGRYAILLMLDPEDLEQVLIWSPSDYKMACELLENLRLDEKSGLVLPKPKIETI
jgi:hypothetical protein